MTTNLPFPLLITSSTNYPITPGSYLTEVLNVERRDELSESVDTSLVHLTLSGLVLVVHSQVLVHEGQVLKYEG